MTITFPMWFIYLWAVTIVLGLVNSVRAFLKTTKSLCEMPGKIAAIITPEISEKVAKEVAENLKVELDEKISEEYIVTKKPVRKAKKEKTEDAEVH